MVEKQSQRPLENLKTLNVYKAIIKLMLLDLTLKESLDILRLHGCQTTIDSLKARRKVLLKDMQIEKINNIYQCVKCNTIIHHKRKGPGHEIKEHFLKENKTIKESDITSFRLSNATIIHRKPTVKEETSYKYKCQKCDNTFRTIEKLRNHKYKKHSYL